MAEAERDVIDLLIDAREDTAIDRIRRQRPTARENAQKSFEALFAPGSPSGVTVKERYAIATFVASLHRDDGIAAFYRDGLAALDMENNVAEAIESEANSGAAAGPYGRYPKGPLSIEDGTGPVHQVSAANRRILGARLSAALEHAHLLVFRPREASPAALQALAAAGWSTTEIVTLSQLVAFLCFQIRAIVGLKALANATIA